MQVMAYRSNGDTSNIERVFLYKDSGATAGTEGDPITGLTFTSTGLNISTIAHNEAAPNTDTSAATSSVEAVGTLGTYSAPTAGFVRFSEVDATDMPGLYELQWEDARYAVASAIWLDVTISGVADLAPFHGRIYTNPLPSNLTAMGGVVQSATDLKDFADAGYDPGTNKVQGVVLVDTATALTNVINASSVVASISGNVDGNVTGSVGSNLELGPAEVNTEVDNSMVTYGLDHLVQTTVTGTDIANNSIIARLVSKSATADWDDFVNTTDSLQSIRDELVVVDGIVDAIKVVTDKFAFTVANQVDSNVLQIEGADATDTLLAAVNAALDTAIAEIAQGVPSATPTMRTGLMLMYMALRNKLDVPTVATDTLELHNDAGTRIAQKLITDNGTDYSEAKMTSGA